MYTTPFLQRLLQKLKGSSKYLFIIPIYNMALFTEMEMAEQELASFIESVTDFFDSCEERDATVERIRLNPEAILASTEKPFMKKIARGIMAVTALQVKKLTTPSFTQALAEQKAFLEAQMNEKLVLERARTEEMLRHQQAYFEGLLATEMTRLDREFEDYKRVMRASFGLLSSEIEMKGEHLVNVSKLLKRFMPAVGVLVNLTEVDWKREVDKCVPL